MRRWGRGLFRHRRRVLWAALAVAVAAGVLGLPVFGALDADGDFNDAHSEGVRASAALARASGQDPAPSLVVLLRLPAPAGTPAAQ
jgi:hypothetical protein